MPKFLIVARYEFSTNVRRWEFLLMTLGLPLLTGLLIVLASVPNMMYLQSRANSPGKLRVAVVGAPAGFHFESGAFRQEGRGPSTDLHRIFPHGTYTFRTLPDKDAAVRAVAAGAVDWAYLFAPDYMESGRVEVLRRRKSPFDLGPEPPMRALLREQLLRGRVAGRTLERVREPMLDTEVYLDERGERIENPTADQLISLFLPYAVMMLMMMPLLGSSNYILRSLAEERESRVQEILLSALRPADLFYGKILGLGGLGLFQVLVWLALVSPLAASLLAVAPLTRAAVGVFLIYFLLGFALYAAIIAGIGAVGSSEKESNQIFAVFVLVLSSPLLFMPILVDAPDGWLQRAFSIFPLTSPLTMVMRTVRGGVSLPDLALSLGLLLLCVWAAMRLSLKVFEMGLLMYGKTPTPLEIWRALTRPQK